MRYFTGVRAAQSDSAIRLGHTAVGMEPLVRLVLAAGRALEKELAPTHGVKALQPSEQGQTPVLAPSGPPLPGTTPLWAAPVITVVKKKAHCESVTHL